MHLERKINVSCPRYPRNPMADESWRLPNIVQELAAGVQEPPSRYLLRDHDQIAGAEIPEPIPTIDLGRLSGSNGADEATKLRSALQNWGLFLVSNHGVETSLIDAVTEAAREFFRQPVEEKKKHSNLIDGKHFQIEGYGNDPVQTKDQVLDWSDRLHLKVEPESERNLAFWPTHPKSFRNILHEYTLKIRTVKINILLALAKLLELDEDCLINQFSDKALTTARFNYYSPCPRPDLVLGLKPHSDLCALTVLLMDKDVGGLQILRDGTWYSVPTVRDYSLLINFGLTLEIMTNGIFRAPVHRAVTNAEKERISVAMFYAVDAEKVIKPVADVLGLARYRTIKGKDLLVEHYEHFSRGAKVVDSLKI
uniref:Fe2OG dioxygenase domain-containing protein n=2 Tax=Leersia perrieri TaxID=77586 RepID=A0A0D9WMH7_9ORYZ